MELIKVRCDPFRSSYRMPRVYTSSPPTVKIPWARSNEDARLSDLNPAIYLNEVSKVNGSRVTRSSLMFFAATVEACDFYHRFGFEYNHRHTFAHPKQANGLQDLLPKNCNTSYR